MHHGKSKVKNDEVMAELSVAMSDILHFDMCVFL